MPSIPLKQFGSAHVAAAESFYSLTHTTLEHQACQGLACFVARHLRPNIWTQATAQQGKLYCLGKCYGAPATTEDTSRPHIAIHARQPIILERIINGGTRSLAAYQATGGYQILTALRRQPPEQTLAAIEASNLRGRGGAGFPTGRKWRTVAAQPPGIKYVVANADEGDPAAFIDRFIIEDDPHNLIEAMAIAAHAVGATKGYIYLRKEYPDAIKILTAAIAEARAAKILGTEFDINLFEGHGSYVCGEETALLNSIEGRRAEVRARPPYPTESGLWGKPTLVNNVETFANIPWIMRHGPDAFRQLGFSKSQGTKAVSLNSLFNRPGLYEVEFGVTLRHIVEDLGGGLRTDNASTPPVRESPDSPRSQLQGLIIGGPLAGATPPSMLDTQFGFDELQAVGAMVGHGGILAFDHHTSIPELLHHIAEFAARESCGKCTPCRRGSQQMATAIAHGRMSPSDFADLNAALFQTSLCGLGTGLAEFTRSLQRYFPQELASCIK